MEDFLAALGLMLVFEGILPFLQPSQWRQLLASMMMLDDRVIRGIGLASMLIGTTIFYFMRSVS